MRASANAPSDICSMPEHGVPNPASRRALSGTQLANCGGLSRCPGFAREPKTEMPASLGSAFEAGEVMDFLRDNLEHSCSGILMTPGPI